MKKKYETLKAFYSEKEIQDGRDKINEKALKESGYKYKEGHFCNLNGIKGNITTYQREVDK